MSSAGDEISILTPPGVGGVHVLWIREQSGRWLDAHFRPHGLSPGGTRRVRVGAIVDGDEVIDEVIVRERETGGVEVHCHGGPAVSARILGLAERDGLARTPPGPHLLPGDRIQREALACLIGAETDLVARVLADQVDGALSRRIQEIREMEPAPATDALEGLLETARFGIHAVRPRTLWIVGPPNSGKSTLMNALVGWDRTIVHDGEGTTRDLVRERTSVGGIPLDLVDTPGGEWSPGQPGLLCIDGSEPSPPTEWLDRLDPGRDLLVQTKADLPRKVRLHGALVVSAMSGAGMDALRRRMTPDPLPAPGAPVVFTRAMESGLRQARDAFRQGRVDLAGDLLQECRFGAEN